MKSQKRSEAGTQILRPVVGHDEFFGFSFTPSGPGTTGGFEQKRDLLG